MVIKEEQLAISDRLEDMQIYLVTAMEEYQ